MIIFVKIFYNFKIFTMVNKEDFSKRLHRIFEYYDLSASGFADKIQVGRASISHLLSGRNNPSLDFVLKVVNAFPEVELYWLLNGKGKFPNTLASKESDKGSNSSHPLSPKDNPRHSTHNFNSSKEDITFSETELSSSAVERIVIFYKNGTFKSYLSD